MLGRRARPKRFPHVSLVFAMVAMLLAPLAGSFAAPDTYQSASHQVVVATDVLNVRSGPGLGHPVIFTVTHGEVYLTGGEQTAVDGYTWSRLMTTSNATLGWVADQYLSTDTAGGETSEADGWVTVGNRVVVTTRVNFRAGPATSDNVIRLLETGSVLTLTDGPVSASGYVWYQGRTTQATGAETGWMIQDGLTAADAEMPDPGLEYEPGAVVHVASGGLRLRAEPTTASTVLASLDAGTTLAVTGWPVGAVGYTWYPVTCPWGATGWVAADYLAYGAGGGGSAPAPEAGTAIVDTPRLNMRSGAGTNNGVVGILAGGTTLNILEGPVPATGYTWYRVQTPNGAQGWVIGEALVR